MTGQSKIVPELITPCAMITSAIDLVVYSVPSVPFAKNCLRRRLSKYVAQVKLSLYRQHGSFNPTSCGWLSCPHRRHLLSNVNRAVGML